MPRSKGYKDSGDRVIVINPAAFGERGIVMYNDGSGEVSVQLDRGDKFDGYEGRDLIYEDEELPAKPVDVGPIGPQTGSQEVLTDEEGKPIATVTDLLPGSTRD